MTAGMIPHTVAVAARLVDTLTKRHWRLAIAESCTGGLLGAYVTACPGASRVFDQGFVCYANAAKTQILGVEQSLMQRYGAVSAPVAAQMAAAAAARAGTDLGLALTGIAGPDGGSDAKPIGLVFGSLNFQGLDQGQIWHLQGDRTHIREEAVTHCLTFALKAIQKLGRNQA